MIGYKYPLTALGGLTSGAQVVHSMNKDQLVDKWYKRNRLLFVDNEIRLHCRQNKRSITPIGSYL
jgi:hypothetical protein